MSRDICIHASKKVICVKHESIDNFTLVAEWEESHSCVIILYQSIVVSYIFISFRIS